MTAEEALKHLRSTDTEEQLAILRELSSLEAMPELYDTTVENLRSPEPGVVFFSLDMLIKKYAAQTRRDAELLTPQLIQLLSTGYGPVVDRAIWALSVTGENSINELIRCIISSTDERSREAYTWALSRNAHIRQYPMLVVTTLRGLLQDKNPHIQYAALNALMDMSPLRPFERLASDAYDFEPVYTELEVTAQALLKAHIFDTEWIDRYLELLHNRHKPNH
ncbi:HEAT repeat domain-containing protein [Hymenobacter canadensis]|uniref:HEAT repeat domain-containing protein n=1 Tax=Hymenobacter canadensis TaxID=2999067 RepID=A0ABY7LWK8_9BACT|nr:hypothetical protein [Hymenobacter canadensis]WBA43313.1 hypothetical protein O3303_07030 [Hymenobacter canadensis]